MVVFERAATVFWETVWPLVVVDAWAMPKTDCDVPLPLFWLAVDRLRTVLPVIVLAPLVVTIPRIWPAELVPA